jgi:hypothetical protein
MPDLPLSDERVAEIASALVLDHARDVEFLTIHEHFEDVPEMAGASEAEQDEVAARIAKLIATATVTVELADPTEQEG